jgi:hypothetical protein
MSDRDLAGGPFPTGSSWGHTPISNADPETLRPEPRHLTGAEWDGYIRARITQIVEGAREGLRIPDIASRLDLGVEETFEHVRALRAEGILEGRGNEVGGP